MLELKMTPVPRADAVTQAGKTMAEAPSDPGTALRVGRDASVCCLVTPEKWLFVSRVHLEFVCGPDDGWQVTWLRGSLVDPSSEVRLTVGEHETSIGYGGTVPLPRGGAGGIVIYDRSAPRSINVGFNHELV